MPAAKLTFSLACLLLASPVVGLRAEGAVTPASDGGSGLSDPSKLLLYDTDDEPIASADKQAMSPPAERYFFGLLDRRSREGKDFFPDPFLGPEFNRETQLELDYAHGESRGSSEDEADAGFQWNAFSQLTLAGEFGWDSEHESKTPGSHGEDVGGENGHGFENVDLAAYQPVFQAVSRDGIFDDTAVLRLDVGIPTHTAVSGTDLQLTPYLGQLLRIDEHFSLEAWAGAEFTVGPHRTDQLIDGALFGYRIDRHQVPLPWTESVTALLEFDGQQPFSGSGREALFGVAGVQWKFTGRGEWQPSIGVGYKFPVDQGAHDQLRWGIVTQAFLEF